MTKRAIKGFKGQGVTPKSRALDLGCGKNKTAGAFGVDIADWSDRDMTIDLAQFPWPLPSDHFYVVHAYDILEHLPKPVSVLNEIWRVCAHGALVSLSVPNGWCDGLAQNPQHFEHGAVTAFTPGSFGYFALADQYEAWLGKQAEPRYTESRFQLLRYWAAPSSRQLFWKEIVPKDELWVLMVAVKEAKDEKA